MIDRYVVVAFFRIGYYAPVPLQERWQEVEKDKGIV